MPISTRSKTITIVLWYANPVDCNFGFVCLAYANLASIRAARQAYNNDLHMYESHIGSLNGRLISGYHVSASSLSPSERFLANRSCL